jgi:hypothetical protein
LVDAQSFKREKNMQSAQQSGYLAKQVFNLDLPVQVCHSAAGFYIGTMHPDDGPFSRESNEYFPTKQLAEEALASGNWSQLEFDRA